jgi:hypothetical protein
VPNDLFEWLVQAELTATVLSGNAVQELESGGQVQYSTGHNWQFSHLFDNRECSIL